MSAPGPPPKKPIFAKRAGLKRTLSVGNAPKKSSVVAPYLARTTPGQPKVGFQAPGRAFIPANATAQIAGSILSTSTSTSKSGDLSYTTPTVSLNSSGGIPSSNGSGLKNINNFGGSLASPSGASGPNLSPMHSHTRATSVTSPRAYGTLTFGERERAGYLADHGSHSPRRMAIDKFESLIEASIPGSLSPKRERASSRSGGLSPISSTSSSLENDASPMGSKSPPPGPRTGAQMRPPVPKKHISVSSVPVEEQLAAGKPGALKPAVPTRSASPPGQLVRDINASPHRAAPPPPSKTSTTKPTASSSVPHFNNLANTARADQETSPTGGDASKDQSANTVFNRARSPRTLSLHYTAAAGVKSSMASNGIASSPSDPAITHADASSSDTTTQKLVDDQGRAVTVGKPRGSNYYQLDFAALDLELGSQQKKKSSKQSGGFKIGNLAKGIANLVPKRSATPATIDTGSSESVEDDEVDTSEWPTLKREKAEWPESTFTSIPQDVLTMVDQSVLKAGFHIEYGDPSITEPPALKLEHCTEYVPFYTEVLFPVEHSNYVAFDDETDMYWVVSIEDKPKGRKQDCLRALVRNRKDYKRVNIDISTLSSSFTDSFTKGASIKMAALSKIMPELEKLKWTRVKNPDLNDELKSMEDKEVKLGSSYKFGVLYVRPGQTEDGIFANNDPKPEFYEFMDMMGSKINLFRWDKYRGGLDVKINSTGEHSYYHEIHGVSVMFHVCTLLPSQENDVQRVERKRHIGNDVVTFIYLEDGCEPYLATKLTSQFIHVHYVVQRVAGTGIGTDVNAYYRLSVVTKYGVEPHLPSFASPSIHPKSPALRDFLLTKAINSERTAMLATEFRSKMLRARKDFLKHLYEQFSNNKTKKSRGSSPANH